MKPFHIALLAVLLLGGGILFAPRLGLEPAREEPRPAPPETVIATRLPVADEKAAAPAPAAPPPPAAPKTDASLPPAVVQIVAALPPPPAPARPPAAAPLPPKNAKATPAPEPTKAQKQRKIADDFFTTGTIPRLKIDISPEQLERLKKDERNYVEGTLTEETPTGPKVFKSVAFKLKGSAGSFQHLDQKPGLTVNMDKLKGGDRFYGLKKFHLNNGVQDNSFLNELLSGEIARKAGVPASRCTHAFVTLNGRDLGLYVFKEAFTKDFLSHFFKETDGAMYEVPSPQEINENMEKAEGDPKDRRDVKELIAAASEPDNAKRWERLGKILDLDKFISFCAMEDILGHWDGYNFNRNNYRLYNDPQTGKFSFFLHGMDQMFSDLPIRRDWPSLVGGAVMRCPQAQPLYFARVESIFTNVLKAEDWPARAVAAGKRVQAAIAVKDANFARDFEGRINETRGRVEGRIAAIGKQLAALPVPVKFDANGVLKLPKGWHEENAAGAKIDEAQSDGKACLHIVAQAATSGSWRNAIHLEAGKYRFQAMAKTAGVFAIADEKGKGAGLRVSGSGKRANGLDANAAWQWLNYEFETGEADVVLVAELRASKGEAWFQTDSLQLVRAK